MLRRVSVLRFPDFRRFSVWLDSRGLFHMELTLGRMREALRRLKLARPGFTVVQVVGTNGKGSTSACIERLAREHGVRTGLYSSPHFLSFRERVRVNGEMLPEDEWVAIANFLLGTCGDIGLTYFEFLTVAALVAFDNAGVQLAVLEAGLGGTWDATTAVGRDLVAFAPFGMDHEGVLGATLTEISTDKAGAMRRLTLSGTAFTGPQEADAMAVLQTVSQETGVGLREVNPQVHDLLPEKVSLPGPHQRDNAALALMVWHELRSRLCVPCCDDKEKGALVDVFVPGRFQRIAATDAHPELIFDGAHNVPALDVLLEALRDLKIAPSAVVFSCFADKNIPGITERVRALSEQPVFIPPIAGTDRAADPEQLAQAVGGNAQPCETLDAALEAAYAHAAGTPGPVLICGSLYLLAGCYTCYPDYLAPDC